ncbi:acyl-CoA dehydrogenase NM domain-like protein [Clavulina sp. PMI_390]|nr:acyl-CoA dehydrogenase NM domain-like protein [Clavulina sp. PMI_390]
MSAPKAMRQITAAEVEKRNKEGDLWVIIDAKVYDLSKFADLHPGGKAVLLEDDIRGQDVTDTFYSLHKGEVLLRPQYKRLQIGVVPGEEERFAPLPAGSLSPVPYGEPQWLTKGYYSPYYKESHRRLRSEFRKFTEEVIVPEALKCEASGKRFSDEFARKLGEINYLGMRVGPGKHLKGRKLVNGAVAPEEFDYFHELIVNSEAARTGQRGFFDGLLAGGIIGVPTILNYASEECKKLVLNDCLDAKKFMCLAITEAFAGSDVQGGLKTKAVLTEDKKHWIITGTKKWITNGMFSDFFATACRTGKGLTMILIPRGEGVETKPIKTSYSPTAGTAFVTFDHVKVPVEYTLGEVNQGLKVILSNFNHERWMMNVQSVQAQRNIVDQTMRWANQRIVFGKPLIEQAVVRNKIAQMISRVESCQTWLEHITYQMCNMSYDAQSTYLAGPIGLCKQFCTRAGQETSKDAVQIFGGRGITQTGMGSAIEHYHRTIQFDAVLGGAEDVLADLGVRQALKFMPKNVRL